MIVRGELVIVIVAVALALIAITSFLSRRLARWRTSVATLGCLMAGLGPILLFPYLPIERAHGTALWEWSAVGGPTIQASYVLDGLAVIGLSIGALYCAAALIATTASSLRGTRTIIASTTAPATTSSVMTSGSIIASALCSG